MTIYSDDYDFEYSICHHGVECVNCVKCDEEIEADGGIDKCLNCGRYKSGNSLNKDQICKRGCRNPNEY